MQQRSIGDRRNLGGLQTHRTGDAGAKRSGRDHAHIKAGVLRQRLAISFIHPKLENKKKPIIKWAFLKRLN
jgi:hypothetical protein